MAGCSLFYTSTTTPQALASAVAGVALAVGAAAAAVGGLAGLGRRLELGLVLRRHAEYDGGLGTGALLLKVRVHLAAKSTPSYLFSTTTTTTCMCSFDN
jgi:hypothetical protein